MTLGREPATDAASQLCDRLYRRHLMGLVSFARKTGCDEHAAWDVVQDLFLRILRRGMFIQIATWTEEMQRAWLLRTLRWIIGNQHRDRTRLKRGSAQAHESLDFLLEGGLDISGPGTPATEHDRRWAISVLERGMARLRADLKPAAWAGFESTLWGTSSATTGAMRVAGHRARRRLRELIRCESNEAALYLAAAGQN